MSALTAAFDGSAVGDQRLHRRARRVLAKRGDKPTLSIPAACDFASEIETSDARHDKRLVFPGAAARASRWGP